MSTDWIPRSDTAAYHTLRAFAHGINDNVAMYGLAPSDGTTLVYHVEHYGLCLRRVAPGAPTRTQAAVCEKNQVRVGVEGLCRRYYSQIKVNAGVSDASKILIGVRPENRGRQKIKCPGTSPLVNFIAATPNQHLLRCRDSLTPSSLAKPFGAIALQLFMTIADEPARNPEEAKFYGSFTRSVMTVKHEPTDGGKYATYWGRWTSRRGDTGPWSAPIRARVI